MDIRILITSLWYFQTLLGDDLDRNYPIIFDIHDTTDKARSAYLDIHLEINSECQLRTTLYEKRDDFNFPICGNITATSTYRVYSSQLIIVSLLCLSVALLAI